MTENYKIICPNCRNELPSDSCFCQYCGNKIGATDSRKNMINDYKKEKIFTEETVTHKDFSYSNQPVDTSVSSSEKQKVIKSPKNKSTPMVYRGAICKFY